MRRLDIYRSSHIPGSVRANSISYNAAISACEKGNSWQAAVRLLEAMPKAPRDFLRAPTVDDTNPA